MTPLLRNWPAPVLPSIIDSTMLADYRTCPRLFAWRHLYKLSPSGPNIHLRAGGAFAAGIHAARLAYWKEGKSEEAALHAALVASVIEYGDACLDPEDSSHKKSLPQVWRALDGYFREWPLGSDHLRILDGGEGHPAVEFSFAIPIHRPSGEPLFHPETGDPFLLAGRVDAVVERDGLLFTLDEKTCKALGPSWAIGLDMRGQFVGYCWAATEGGLLKPSGWIVRKIKFGGPRSDFEYREHYHFLEDWRLHEWHADLCNTLDNIIHDWTSGHFQKVWNDTCCSYGGCKFLPLCTTPEPSDVLVPEYEYRNWNPLEHKVEA